MIGILGMVIGLVLTTLTANAAPTRQVTPTPAVSGGEGTLVADIGFRPARDGFSFENYTNREKPTNLTPDDMHTLFGKEVCVGAKETPCRLTPLAKQRMDRFNDLMNGGHCDGMATLSLLMYVQNISPARFGGISASQLSLKANPELQREIAKWFTTQLVNPTRREIDRQWIDGTTPAAVLDMLIKGMTNRSDYFVIQFFDRPFKRGHAVTPYAVRDMGNGLYHILVYDNNLPGQERYITLNRTANTWSYVASVNPSVAATPFEGDAESRSLKLLPLGVRLARQECDFCAPIPETVTVPGSATPAPTAVSPTTTPVEPTFNQVLLTSDSFDNRASLLIRDDKGRRLGYDGQTFYREIPNAFFTPITSGVRRQDTPTEDGSYTDSELWSDTSEPIFFIPSGVPFTVEVDGSALSAGASETASVAIFGAGINAMIEEIQVTPGKKDLLGFSADSRTLTYQPASSETPDILVGLDTSEAGYAFLVRGVELSAGGSVSITLDAGRGQFWFGTKGTTESATYDLLVLRAEDDQDTPETFYADGLTLAPGEVVYVDWGAWTGKDELPVEIDSDGDGAINDRATLKNEPLPGGTTYLQAASTGQFAHIKGDLYTLTLSGAATTLYASLNPVEVLTLDTGRWTGEWSAGNGHNGQATAHAILELDRASLEVVLSAPSYAADSSSVTYQARLISIIPVGARTPGNAPPGAFGTANLIITQNYALKAALTKRGKTNADLIAVSASPPITSSGGVNPPDVHAGGVNPPDVHAGDVNDSSDISEDGTLVNLPLSYHQFARGGTITLAGAAYTLTLTGVYPMVQAISQAPKLGTAWVSGDALYKTWELTGVPVRATIQSGKGRALVSLSDPISDPAKGTVTFAMTLVDGTLSTALAQVDLLLLSDGRFEASLTLGVNYLLQQPAKIGSEVAPAQIAGGLNPPDVHAGGVNPPDVHAGGVNPPDVHAGDGATLTTGGVNLLFGSVAQTEDAETQAVCYRALKGIIQTLTDETLSAAEADAEFETYNDDAIGTCPLSSVAFTPEARRIASGIASLALPPKR